jgi:hypothetical protein
VLAASGYCLLRVAGEDVLRLACVFLGSLAALACGDSAAWGAKVTKRKFVSFRVKVFRWTAHIRVTRAYDELAT